MIVKKFVDFTMANKFKILTVATVICVIAGGLFIWMQRENTSWKRAEDYYRRADYVKAAAELKNVTFPEDAERLRIYGQTMYATNDYSKSTKAYEKLFEKTKDPFAKLMVGNIANQSKNYDSAIQHYSDLINLYPNYVTGYSNLAMVYRLKGDLNQALATATKGATNNPTNTEVRVLMVSLLASSDETKNSPQYKEALENLKKLDPKNPYLTQMEGNSQ